MMDESIALLKVSEMRCLEDLQISTLSRASLFANKELHTNVYFKDYC